MTSAAEVWSAAVTVQLIASLGLVLVALVGAATPVWRRLGRIKAAAEATHAEAAQAREQVANDHDTNLRDDMDAVGKTARKALEVSEEARDLAREGRDLAVSNQAAFLALAAEVRHLGERRRRRRWL